MNSADLVQIRGQYPPPPGSRVRSDVPGLELAGIVLEVGAAVTRFQPGDQVMSLVAGAAQAERAVVHERIAMPMPEHLSFAEAGAFPETFMTAFDAVLTRCALSVGERLLVLGAAGGVGTAAVQLGVLAGAEVVASVRAEALHDQVAALGATVVVPGDEGNHGPYDVILELVGVENLNADLAQLATEGRVIVIGTGPNRSTEINVSLLLGRRAKLLGAMLRYRSLEEKAAVARLLERQVLPALERGQVRVPVHTTFPLSQVEAAYEQFRQGKKFGKIVLVADDA
jgi:NADPH2:quinone reductase